MPEREKKKLRTRREGKNGFFRLSNQMGLRGAGGGGSGKIGCVLCYINAIDGLSGLLLSNAVSARSLISIIQLSLIRIALRTLQPNSPPSGLHSVCYSNRA